MPTKPVRSRSHELESESRIAFESAIPSNWVFRGINPDYGIDGSVEIFDAAGEATGLQFLVQLKASSSWVNKRSVRLKRSTFDYLIEQPHPCVIVLFDATTKQLKYQWLEGVPSYTIKVGERFVSLPTESFKVFKDVEKIIERELALLRNLTNGQYSLPLGLRIEVEGAATSHLHYATAAELVVKRSRGLLRLATENYPGLAVCVRVATKGTVFELSVRYHFWGSFEDSETIEEVAESLASGILLLLLVSQKFDLLNAFAQVFCRPASLPHNRKLMPFVCIALIRNGHAVVGFTILAGLLKKGCTADEIREVRMGLRGIHVEYMAAAFACTELTKIRTSVSLSTDSAAEFDWLLAALYHQLKPSTSYGFYRKAVSGQPLFRRMPEFWRELADCQLRLERYSSAKRCFLVSHAFESDVETLCGAANAALWAGEMGVAEGLFTKAGQGGIRGINRQKLYAIRAIMRYTKSNKISRNPKKAKQELLRHAGGLVPKDACLAVLQLDPLNAVAWRNLGMQNANDGDVRRGAEQVLIAASLARDEGRYWAEAHFMMMFLGKRRFAEQMLNAGCWTKGPAFAADFKEVAERELRMGPVPPEFLKDIIDRGSFLHEDAHNQADRRYSLWLQKINKRAGNTTTVRKKSKKSSSRSSKGRRVPR